MATRFDMANFTRQLLEPLPEAESAALLDEVHEEKSIGFQKLWFLAEVSFHRRQAQFYERLGNSFFGDNTMQDCPALAEQARKSAAALVFTAALNATQLSTKRAVARRIYPHSKSMPENWHQAFAADERYIDRKRQRRLRSLKRGGGCSAEGGIA